MKLLTVILLGLLVVFIPVAILFRMGVFTPDPPSPPPPPPPGPTLAISVVTALPAEPWLNEMAERYNSGTHLVENRPVKVEVIPMDGLSALNKWGRGEFEPVPTAWLAESRAWVDQANVDTLKRVGRDVFLSGGQYRAQPVVLSPIVWGIWDDAYEALQIHFGTDDISWDELHEAAVTKEWAKMGGRSEWGKFKMVIAHPKRDPAGLTAMVGAAGEYFDDATVDTEQLKDAEFQAWLKEMLDTVVDFSPFGVENMLLFGRSSGDAGQIVESYLLVNMEGLQGRWKPLRIVYPDPLAWFDFPYAVYMGPETSAVEKAAALDFKRFLLSTSPQRSALDFGLRPANPSVSSTGGLVERWSDLGVQGRISSASRMRQASRSGLDALMKWFCETYGC